MENKDTNMDYQQIVMVGNEKWGIVEITIGIIFFAWDLEIRIHYFLYMEFSSPTWKKSPKVPIPNQNFDLT